MQSDPLSDTAALRYQYESDEEEDEPFPLGNPATPEQTAGVSFIGSVDPTEHLIVAFGEAGRTWASGADLGEQTGAITVNNIQASFVFVPRWGERRVTVIISEPSGSLPLWAMADYARRILTIVQPKRLSLLDIYPVHVYAASEPITIHGAPIRYLALNSPFEPLSGFDAYEPPNLVQSSAAAFMSLIANPCLVGGSIPSTLLLLPATHAASIPSETVKTTGTTWIISDCPWSEEAMQSVHHTLFSATAGITVPRWKSVDKAGRIDRGAVNNVFADSNDMYI